MSANLFLFPVGNGDMTLIKLESGRTILIDTNIRAAADHPDEPTPDIASMLRQILNVDAVGRSYVDVLLLTHPDQDHCRGMIKHLHLGKPEDYCKEDNKIFVREMWSSPIVFRRASRILTLCDDAKAFATEARRRVQYFRDHEFTGIKDGDRILILGEDENGKTDDLTSILVKVGQTITKVNGEVNSTLTACLLGPLSKANSEEAEEALAKNRSSVILQFRLSAGGRTSACRFLAGGDAEVAIWERLWEEYRNSGWLEYDVLLTPHHCSWHSLSYDSWSKKGKNAVVSETARTALSQARPGAIIIASSKPIRGNDTDPPCIGAKHEYEKIADSVHGQFKCTGEYPSQQSPDLIEIEITAYGPRLKSKSTGSPFIVSGAIGRQPLGHG